jgi:hypothetical protein
MNGSLIASDSQNTTRRINYILSQSPNWLERAKQSNQIFGLEANTTQTK